jgi:SHS2 domain-containing protein
VTRFEILEHPADIGFRTFGSTLPELFENAALALLSVAYEPGHALPREEFPIEAAASDYEALLVNFLNEVLYWADGKRLALERVEVRELTLERILAAVFGEPRDPARHPAKVIVKAVTYHQLRLEQTPSGWVAEVYLDI